VVLLVHIVHTRGEAGHGNAMQLEQNVSWQVSNRGDVRDRGLGERTNADWRNNPPQNWPTLEEWTAEVLATHFD
jgi:hypothetical protein